MTYKQWDETWTNIFNLLWFGSFLYIVFWKGYSGWWLLFPVFVHFYPSKNK